MLQTTNRLLLTEDKCHRQHTGCCYLRRIHFTDNKQIVVTYGRYMSQTTYRLLLNTENTCYRPQTDCGYLRRIHVANNIQVVGSNCSSNVHCRTKSIGTSHLGWSSSNQLKQANFIIYIFLCAKRQTFKKKVNLLGTLKHINILFFFVYKSVNYFVFQVNWKRFYVISC